MVHLYLCMYILYSTVQIIKVTVIARESVSLGGGMVAASFTLTLVRT